MEEYMVPHLATTLTGPLNELEQHILDSTPAVERWFRLEWMEHTPTLYSAVVLRNSGFKVGPMYVSLFPDCWQLLSPDVTQLCVQAAMAAIEKICPEAQNLLIIPDDRLEEPSYLANLQSLRKIFRLVGLNVRFASIHPEFSQTRQYALPDGADITVEPLLRDNNRVGLPHFSPCAVLLNNPLSNGIPGILEDLFEQYILPPPHAGVTMGTPSLHARCYEELCKRFGKFLGIDPWLISPLYSKCEKVDLFTPAGKQALAASVDALLAKIRRKYKEYRITDTPVVSVRLDTDPLYGVLVLSSGSELETAMAQAKPPPEGSLSLVLQEGVHSCESIDDMDATPVVYTIDRYVVGGYYRTGKVELNAPITLNADSAASFYPLVFDASVHQTPGSGKKPAAAAPNRFYMYGVIARLSMLAASYALEATDPQNEPL